MEIGIPATFILGLVVAALLHIKRMRRLAAERGNGSISSFIRNLDCYGLDPLVVRATHEEFQKHFAYISPAFPIRATDKLEGELHMDDDDASDIIGTVAKRCGRIVRPTGDWLSKRKLKTVADLVRYVCDLPKA